jgi:hypothetical protein
MQAKQLPVFVHGLLEARNKNQEAENRFFDKWPQLKAVDRGELKKVFQTYRSLNPNADPETFIEKAGQLACVQLGVPLQVAPAAAPQTQQMQVRTLGPVVRPNGAAPHVPVGSGTAPAPVAPQLSEIERMFELLKATDEGAFDN